jgi:hypothetical protein
MKTKKLKNVKRKTLKGGFFWSTKRTFTDEIIEQIFRKLNPLQTITYYDKKNMKNFKKTITKEFINEYKKLNLDLNLDYESDSDSDYDSDSDSDSDSYSYSASDSDSDLETEKPMNTLLKLLEKHNYIVYPQIEHITPQEKYESYELIYNYDDKNHTKLKKKSEELGFIGGFWWKKNIYDEIFDTNNTIRKGYNVAFSILTELCYTSINDNDIHFLKNVKHFKQIISRHCKQEYINFAELDYVRKRKLNINDVTVFLLKHNYNVHYSIEKSNTLLKTRRNKL